MFPILFKFGPLTLYTFNILVVIACLVGAFIFWRKTHFEHFEDDEVFDITLLSIFFGLLIARVGYIVLHISDFQFDILSWISFFQKPGLHEVFGLLGGLSFLGWQAKKKKWDHFEILDMASLGVTFFFCLLWIARFFSGSQIGTGTSLPIGIIFPNTLEKRHPVQLYLAISFYIGFFLLTKLESRYRFFAWYRGGKQAAQSGFLTGAFFTMYGLINMVWSIVRLPDTRVMNIPVDVGIYLLLFLAGIAIIFFRSAYWKSSRKTSKPKVVEQNRIQLNWMQRMRKNKF